jgi:hypothetical protein
MTDAEWLPVRTSDWRLRGLRDRHYSGGSGGRTVGPPGRRLALVTFEGTAGWISAWPDPRYSDHGLGDAYLCTLFRNEGAGLSSTLILAALTITERRWGPPPSGGWITFVDADAVRPKRDPGWCFICAGFEPAGFTKDRGLVILRRRGLAEMAA